MEKKAAELLACRKEKRLTQSQMAEILHIGERSYRRYEKGERDVPDLVYEIFLKWKESMGYAYNERKKKEWRKDELLCPYKVKTISRGNGVMTQFFLRCVKNKCALWDGTGCRGKS